MNSTKRKKVLIISLSGIGDSILFSPALKLLHASFPEWEYHVLVMFKSAAEYYSRFREISRIHHFDLVKQPAWRGIRFLLNLRKERFDQVINAYPANRAEYNVVARLLGRQTIGHRYAHYNHANLFFLNRIVLQEEPDRHPADENIALVKALGATGEPSKQLHFPLLEHERARAAQWLADRGLGGKFLIGMHPGSSILKNHTNKRWPASSFAELGRKLTIRYDAEILVFGGSEESSVLSDVATGIGNRCHVLTGIPLGETAAFIQFCRLFVSNDTALMHMAAALHTPCVSVFGPTDLRKGRPYHSPHIVASRFLSCSPCFYYSPRPLRCRFGTFECLRNLPVETVERACLAMLQPAQI